MAYEEIIFPNNIRNIRMGRGITMTALAARANLSLSAMSKIEKGVRRLNQKQLLNLCNILQCKLSDVFVKDSDEIAAKWQSEMSKRLTENESNGLKIFGAGLRYIRKNSGKTIQKAAKDAGMTLSVYHKIEIGQREVYEDEIKPLAKSFGKNKEALFKEIASLYESGILAKHIEKSEEKVRNVLVPGSSLSGTLYGAKIYDTARSKLIPIFGTPDRNGIAFLRTDEKMIVAPANLVGHKSVYAIIPNAKRLADVLPSTSFLFADSEAVAQPGDMAVWLNADETRAQIVMLHEDAKGKLYGQIWGPDEKIPVQNDTSRLHKIVQILMN